MVKSKYGFRERRRYVRLETPVTVSYFPTDGSRMATVVTKNISADGLRFETTDKAIREGDNLEIRLSIVGAANPTHAKTNVIWKKRLSLEDGSPFDVGLEFTEIEEDNKNSFLKSLCDLMYAISERTGKGK
jgi:c-di-GMP-binding flagellar brake protein YcgR